MSANKIKFGNRAIAALSSGPRRAWFYDTDAKHLAVCVHPTGRKVFYRTGRVHGRPCRIKIGDFPDIGVPIARRECASIDGGIADGKNAGPSQRSLRPESTLTSLFRYYIEHHAKPRKSTWRRDERRFHMHLSRWKDRQLSRVGRQDVIRLHVSLGKSIGPYGANHVLELLRMAFSVAIRDEAYDGQNPAVGVKKFETKSRERFLQPDEIPRFFSAVNNVRRDTTRDWILTALFTGARRGNVCAMRWDHLDLSSGVWHVPGDESKNRSPMTIVLTSLVVELLTNRQDTTDGPWVFPGSGKTGHLVEPKAAWQKVLAEAGLEGLRIHDLRRTLGSWQAAAGSSLHIIGKSLGHKSSQATEIYARLQLDPVRESVDAAVNAMLHEAKR